MILMAVSLAVQKPAPASGLSQYGNTGAGSFANTADRAYHMASRSGQTARHPRRSDLPRPFSFHQVSSYSAIAPTMVTALSLENTPTAVAAIRPASQAHRRPPILFPPGQFVQRDRAHDGNRAFLGEHAHRGRGHQTRQPGPSAPALGFGALQVHAQSAPQPGAAPPALA